MVESIPSMNIAPYPTNSPLNSLSSCLEVVPDPTMEWNPDRAPQAMTSGTVGQNGEGCPEMTLAAKLVYAGQLNPRNANTAAIEEMIMPPHRMYELR